MTGFGKDLTNLKGHNVKFQLDNKEKKDDDNPDKSRTVLLKKDQVICPICYSIILEPVTFPCKHSICKTCFDRHIWETSINCPCCRRRLSVWCRQAVKENSIVNRKFQKEIEQQFPIQVAAQKEQLQQQQLLPGQQQQKLDDILSQFLPDDSPPDSQIAKPGEIGHELKEMLSKHLQDIHRAEEAASKNFISKFLSPAEQAIIGDLEENLELGLGFKEKNEECFGNGANFIKLRTRTVHAAAYKSSGRISEGKMRMKKAANGNCPASASSKLSVQPKIPPNQSSLATSQASGLDDHIDFMSAAAGTSKSAKKYAARPGRPRLTMSEKQRKLEEKDYQLALQLQKYANEDETRHYNLRSRNRK